MKKKKKEIIPGNPGDGINLFNQALGNGGSTGMMNESHWDSRLDWADETYPGYNLDEIFTACEALRSDFIDDRAFLKEFIREIRPNEFTYNAFKKALQQDYQLDPDEVDRWSEYDVYYVVEDDLLEIATTVDKSFVEKYLRNHFTPNKETTQYWEFESLNEDVEEDSIKIDGTTFEKTRQYSFQNGRLYYHSYAHPEGVPDNSRPYRVTPKYNMYVSSQRGAALPYSMVYIANKETGVVYSAEFPLYMNVKDTYAKIVEWMRNGGYLEPEPKSEIDFNPLSDEEPFNPFDFDESLNESYLTEDDLTDEIDVDDVGADDIDIDTEETTEPAEDDLTVDEIEDQDNTDVNEMQKKTILFPLLIEGYDEENNPLAMDEEEEEAFASEYGDAVVKNIEDNKKFILSALDLYDMEVYYDSYDSNSHVKFIVTTNEEVDSSSLMNVLKRYFNTEIDNKMTDEGEFTLSPVLDNKFIRVVD